MWQQIPRGACSEVVNGMTVAPYVRCTSRSVSNVTQRLTTSIQSALCPGLSSMWYSKKYREWKVLCGGKGKGAGLCCLHSTATACCGVHTFVCLAMTKLGKEVVNCVFGKIKSAERFFKGAPKGPVPLQRVEMLACQ